MLQAEHFFLLFIAPVTALWDKKEVCSHWPNCQKTDYSLTLQVGRFLIGIEISGNRKEN